MRAISTIIPLLLASISVNAIPLKRYDNYSETTTSLASSSRFTADILSSASILEQDTTITIDEWITVTLPSTTLTVPASATSELKAIEASASAENAKKTSEEDITITSTIVEYRTVTSDGQITTEPTNTYTTRVVPHSIVDLTTTSTITKFTTITQDGTTLTEPVTTETSSGAYESYCVPETVTVTVTKDSASAAEDSFSTITLTSTMTSSYPITAEFTYGGNITTTITSYVQVTSTEVFTTHSKPSASAVETSSDINSSSIYKSAAVVTANNGTFHSSIAPTASAYSSLDVKAKRGILFNF